MGVLDWVNHEAQAAGGWVADELSAPADASAVHSAAPTAPTAPAARDDSFFGSITRDIGEFGRGVQQEGLGAVLDPRGAVDRQEAQQDLASRFNVVAPGTAGAGTENTVTQEQFQQIARQYSDIRMDRSDLHIDTRGLDPEQAAAFRQGTMNDMASLMQTNSGRTQINGLTDGSAKNDDGTERQTYINRINDTQFENNGGRGGGRWGDRNADSGRHPESDSFSTNTEHEDGFVYYRPGEVALPGANNADARSDVALMHELTHANAAIHGTFAHDNVTAADSPTATDLADGVSRSEYQAVGLGTFHGDAANENAYRRDRAAIGASGSGVRDDQGHSDVGMTERTTYDYPSSGGGTTTPETPTTTEGHMGRHQDDEG